MWLERLLMLGVYLPVFRVDVGKGLGFYLENSIIIESHENVFLWVLFYYS